MTQVKLSTLKAGDRFRTAAGLNCIKIAPRLKLFNTRNYELKFAYVNAETWELLGTDEKDMLVELTLPTIKEEDE